MIATRVMKRASKTTTVALMMTMMMNRLLSAHVIVTVADKETAEHLLAIAQQTRTCADTSNNPAIGSQKRFVVVKSQKRIFTVLIHAHICYVFSCCDVFL